MKPSTVMRAVQQQTNKVKEKGRGGGGSGCVKKLVSMKKLVSNFIIHNYDN